MQVGDCILCGSTTPTIACPQANDGVHRPIQPLPVSA